MFYFLLLVLSTLLALTNSVYAASYWVAKTGSDSNTCSQAQSQSTPKLTIASGNACLSAGDTLIVKAGTYFEPNITLNKSGTSDTNRVTYKANPGAVVKIHNNSGMNNPAADIQGLFLTGNWQLFEGFRLIGLELLIHGFNQRIKDVENGYSSGNGFMDLGVGHTQNYELINLHVHHPGWMNDNQLWNHCDTNHASSTGECHGIYASSAGNLIDGGLWHNSFSHAIHLYPTALNWTVRNITVFNNGGPAIAAYDSSAGGHLVYNNVVYNNHTGLRVKGPNVRAYNNTIYNNSVGIEVNRPDQVFRNNILYNNGENFTGSAQGGANLCNSKGGLCTHSGNPDFVNVGLNDFHLQSGSTAINSGLAVNEVTKDYDGVLRPQGPSYDIGAYEYSIGQLLPPSNFRIVSR